MIVAAILDQARRTPARAALIFNDRTYTYEWFARAVATMCTAAQDVGISGPGVALVAVRSLRKALVTSLALRHLGLTTMMVPSSGNELHFVPRNTVCAVTIDGEPWHGLDTQCARHGVPLHVLPFDENDARMPTQIRTHGPEGGHILQTSGTTGEPKYVLYDPATELSFIREWFDIVGLDADSLYGMFDFPLWTAVGYRAPMAKWLAGGAVAMQQDRPPHLLLHHRAMTRATAIPAMLQQILAAPPDAFERNTDLHLAIVGASPSRDLIAATKTRITPHVENRIGSTETRTISTTRLDTPEDFLWHRPATRAQVEVVDQSDRPLPIGSIGQLRVATRGGPTGYHEDPIATQRFFRDGYFYTGDLARLRKDGRFALEGRITDVINVGGFKLAPAPLEAKLCDLLGVTGVCILSMTSGDDERLHVFVEGDRPIDHSEIKGLFDKEFGVFGDVPIFRISHLPRNAMGKIARDEVRAMVSKHSADRSS